MLPSILVLSCYMLECGISRSGTRVYLILIDSVRFLSRKAVTAFYDRTVPKSQMAHFVHKLLNSYSIAPLRGAITPTKQRTALESFFWWEGVWPFGVCCWE